MTGKPRGGAHRWVVDAIAEGTARLEEDGERFVALPLWLLPAGLREGQVLRVTRTPGDDGASVVTITPDPAAAARATARSADQVAEMAKRSKRRDSGGDVAL